MAMKELPPATGDVVTVLLDGGGCTKGGDRLLHADGNDEPHYFYNWCFFIHHKPTGRKIVWDLGLSDDHSLYTPYTLNFIFPMVGPIGPKISLGDQLKVLGVTAEEIDTVIFSHAHWDHCHPAKAEFPNAKILFGPGTRDHCRPGHIHEGETIPTVQWDARFFSDDPSIRSEESDEIKGPWQPWGPFTAAMDYFGDGSFGIIDAPGHMPGNLAACARLASGEHVLLGSDCCHSRAIFEGTREIANIKMPNGTMFCMHDDLDSALRTIETLRTAVNQYGLHLALAHDAEWIKEGKDETLIAILHPNLQSEECRDRIRAGLQPYKGI